MLNEQLAIVSKSYISSLKFLNEALKLMKLKPSIYSNSREVDIVLKLSITYAFLKKFKEAKKILTAIKPSIKKNNFEAYLASKRLVIISLYNNESASALKQIKKLANSKYTLRQPYASSRFQFLKTVCSLYANEAKACCKIILEELKLKYKSSDDLMLGNLMTLSLAFFQLPTSEKRFKISVYPEARLALKRLSTDALNERESIILSVTKKIFEHTKNEIQLQGIL